MFWHRKKKVEIPIETLRRMGHYIPLKLSTKKKHPLIRALAHGERRLEAFLAWLQSLAFLEILGIISNVGILFAISTYTVTEKQRREEVIFTAWQTITNAEGQLGNGGRIKALEFLNASPGANWRRRAICLWICTWTKESLAGISLSASEDGEGIYLVGVNLSNANLSSANLANAQLSEANLMGANLYEADLSDTNLWAANLANTGLWHANMTNALLGDANLVNADMAKADLSNANLSGANLMGANFHGADFTGVNLARANLTRANGRI